VALSNMHSEGATGFASANAGSVESNPGGGPWINGKSGSCCLGGSSK
jgi:hypothetical protein